MARSWVSTPCRGGADARHGIRLPTLGLNLERPRTYAGRMFRHVVVGDLDREDAWDALGIPLAGSGRLVPRGRSSAQIVEVPVGYAYFLQFFGASSPAASPASECRLDDYWAVEAGLLHGQDLAFFEDRYEGASPFRAEGP